MTDFKYALLEAQIIEASVTETKARDLELKGFKRRAEAVWMRAAWLYSLAARASTDRQTMLFKSSIEAYLQAGTPSLAIDTARTALKSELLSMEDAKVFSELLDRARQAQQNRKN